MNKPKLLILAVLMAALTVSVWMLFDIKKTEREIIEENSKTDIVDVIEPIPESEVPAPPMITINAEISHKLDGYMNADEITDRAVQVARSCVNSYITNGIYLSDAIVSDITFIDTNTVSEFDSIEMFNVHLLFSQNDGTKVYDSEHFLIFYHRWDEDGKGVYFVSSLSKNEIEEKYTDASSEYGGDVFTAACFGERYNYLKLCPQFKYDILEGAAYAKAVVFSQTVDGITEVSPDKYTVVNDVGLKAFSYATNNESTVITVAYQYISETDSWTFLYADAGIVEGQTQGIE